MSGWTLATAAGNATTRRSGKPIHKNLWPPGGPQVFIGGRLLQSYEIVKTLWQPSHPSRWFMSGSRLNTTGCLLHG
jgi:hypothetical protein